MDLRTLLDISESQKRKLKADNEALKEHIKVLEQRIAENLCRHMMALIHYNQTHPFE